MDYRLFGASSPSDDFTAGLVAFCALDEVQREALAVWFETTPDFDTFTPKLPANILASNLLPDQFRKTAMPIRYILSAWQEQSLQIQDIERDLLLVGLSLDQVERVTRFVQRLSPVRRRIWIDGLEGTAQITGLPTIDDVNIIWDARGVFGGNSFYFFEHDAADATYHQCLGLTCMAVLELMVSDSNGSKERLAVQMNETTFRSFLRAVNRAKEQLQSLNALIGPMKVGQQNVEG
jgi:hypothetical protein